MTNKNAEVVLREHLRGLLSQCNPDQINIFDRMYGSIDTIEYEKMDWACFQVEKTIEKNEKTSAAVEGFVTSHDSEE